MVLSQLQTFWIKYGTISMGRSKTCKCVILPGLGKEVTELNDQLTDLTEKADKFIKEFKPSLFKQSNKRLLELLEQAEKRKELLKEDITTTAATAPDPDFDDPSASDAVGASSADQSQY